MNAEATRDELFRLAVCITDRASKPIFLGEDNKNAGRARSLQSAWDSDRAFCCMLRSEVVPIDVDQSQLHLVDRYRDEIRASGQPFIETASSGLDRPNRHFFVWIPDDEPRECLVERLRGIGGGEPVRVGQQIRPPGVRHRHHDSYSVPVDCRQVTAVILSVTESDSPSQGQSTGQLMERLSPLTRRVIDNGPPADRSTWDMSVTHRLLSDGLSADEIVHFGLNGSTRFSEKAREREQRHLGIGASYLRLGINKAESFPKNGSLGIRSREDAIRLLDATADAVANTDHRVFGGLMARRVLEGCIQLFAEQSTFERPLSVRTVAETAQVHMSTAWKWLRHLLANRWITEVQGGRHGLATVYRLEIPRFRTLLGSQGGCESKSVRFCGISKNALFRHRYGGESGWRAASALSALGGEASTGSIASCSYLLPKHLGSVLNRLQVLGVVEKVRHGTWRLTGEDLDFLAEHWGADLVEKQQAMRHELDRATYGQYRLSRLAQLAPPDSLLHLQALDSVNACDWLTGETVSIGDLWADPTLILKGVEQ